MIKKTFDRTNRSNNPSQIHLRTDNIQDEDEWLHGITGHEFEPYK